MVWALETGRQCSPRQHLPIGYNSGCARFYYRGICCGEPQQPPTIKFACAFQCIYHIASASRSLLYWPLQTCNPARMYRLVTPASCWAAMAHKLPAVRLEGGLVPGSSNPAPSQKLLGFGVMYRKTNQDQITFHPRGAGRSRRHQLVKVMCSGMPIWIVREKYVQVGEHRYCSAVFERGPSAQLVAIVGRGGCAPDDARFKVGAVDSGDHLAH